MIQLNILIVDDNYDLADGLGAVLEDEGYQVTLTYNGADGIKASNTGRFDVIFLDVKLPDMNGVEVFQKMYKKDPKARVIMMTGYRIEQLLAEVMDSGDVKIIRKPFDVGRMLETFGQIQNESIVLVVGDGPDFAETLSAYLAGHGMKTLLAHNRQEAVDGVLSNPTEILVLDLHMPIMCGLAIYLELKQQGRALKTIILTGYADEGPEAVDTLRSTSVTGCLFKPFTPQDLLRILEGIMAR